MAYTTEPYEEGLDANSARAAFDRGEHSLIESLMKAMSDAIERINHDADILENRLGPVLRKTDKTTGPLNEVEVSKAGSPLGASLTIAQRRLMMTHEKLQALIGELEI